MRIFFPYIMPKIIMDKKQQPKKKKKSYILFSDFYLPHFKHWQKNKDSSNELFGTKTSLHM